MALLREVRDTDLDVLFAHWTDPDANRMAAFAPADPTDREAFDEHWGKGIATRGLAEFLTDVERTRPIQASTADDNVGSQRVLEKCGFRRVGVRRAFATSRGEELDEVLLRLLLMAGP